MGGRGFENCDALVVITVSFQWSIGNEIEWTYPRNAQATGFFDITWEGNYFWEQPPNEVETIKELLATLLRANMTLVKRRNWRLGLANSIHRVQ